MHDLTLRPRKGSLIHRGQPDHSDAELSRCCIYIRVSTEEQQLSIASQEAVATSFAVNRELWVSGEPFKDVGVSACKTNFLDRPAVKAMLRHMKREDIHTILILRIDRAFRNVADCYNTLAILEERGVFFRFMEPDIDFGSPIGRAMLAIMAAFAEYEAGLRSQRQLAAFEEMRVRRVIRNNNPPYGWVRSEAPDPELSTRSGRPTYRLVPHPAEQEHLRQIIRLREVGKLSLQAIADWLNAEKIPTKKAGQTRTWRGKTQIIKGTWHKMTVKSVIEHADLDEETPPPTTL